MMCMTTVFIEEVKKEYYRAIQLFPEPSFLELAWAEEMGEVIKAWMDKVIHGKATQDSIARECVQAAAMCLRYKRRLPEDAEVICLTDWDPTFADGQDVLRELQKGPQYSCLRVLRDLYVTAKSTVEAE